MSDLELRDVYGCLGFRDTVLGLGFTLSGDLCKAAEESTYILGLRLKVLLDIEQEFGQV